MVKRLFSLFAIALIISTTLLFQSCSFSINEVQGNPYSRENTVDLINGYSSSDYDFAVCKFIYNNDEFTKIYGNSFEIKDIAGSSDLKQFMWFFEGTSSCSVYIKKDVWRVNLKKEYFSEWTVTNYFKETK